MAYQVILNGMLLPVAPQKIEVKIKSKSETVTLIDGAEMDILKAPGLSEISFSAELPALPGRSYAVYENGFLPPGYYLQELERLAAGREAFPLILVRLLPDGTSLHNTKTLVSLGDYTITDDAGDGFDTSVKLSLRQYEQKTTYTARLTPTPDGGTRVEATKDRPVAPGAAVLTATVAAVAAGGTLWAAARQYLGDGARWKELAARNGLTGNVVDRDQNITVR